MLEKNLKKKERTNRPLWSGLYTRKTKTKKEKIISQWRKHKNKSVDCL